MLVRKANSEDHDQTASEKQSDLGMPCLSRLLWQATTVQILEHLLYAKYTFFLFQIGTYTISISAKAMNKPFYVVAESFKFARFYPLNQRDVPNEFKVCRHK